MFLKIFLWFWLATALIVGALTLVTWSLQNDPFQSRWQTAVSSSLSVYAETARQIYHNEGERGLEEFLLRLKAARENQDVCLSSRQKNNWCFGEIDGKDAQETIQKAFAGDAVEFSQQNSEEIFVAKKFTTDKNEDFVLTLKIQKPRSLPFWADSRARILRILAVFLTAGLLCYALARYLTSPLRKLREATNQFANGDLAVRVAPRIGKRRDEISGLARDFDNMAERIESLIAAQKNLTTDISHELRSPLARLGVALEIARNKANDEIKPSLDRIERESLRLNAMITQMLLLSKLESGTETVEKTRLDLSKIVFDVAADADFEAQIQNKSVKIITNEKIYVRGESRLLQSAIENIVRNAVRHTPENSSVEISLQKNGERAEIIVRDSGAGVPPEDLDKLFRPFYRVGFARERNAGGFGLGLAIAERAANAHGGTVTAENSNNGGLIVKLNLPVEN